MKSLAERYTLVLRETSLHHYDLTCLELPDFNFYTTSSYLDAVVENGRKMLSMYIYEAKDKGQNLNPPGRGGFIIYGEGAGRLENEIYWSKADLIRILGFSRSTIDRRIADGTFNRYRVGKRVLFKPDQIRQAVSEGNYKVVSLSDLNF